LHAKTELKVAELQLSVAEGQLKIAQLKVTEAEAATQLEVSMW
jgi:hypothetical protein